MNANLPTWPEVLEWARQEGFPLAGAASVDPHPEAVRTFRDWLGRSRQGFLRYMERRPAEQGRLWAEIPWVRSVLCLALPYNTRRDLSAEWVESGRLWISRYAWGRDYHKAMRRRMGPLAVRMEAAGVRTRICVDSAPILERGYAAAAGLGFVGKNCLLVNPAFGSFFFLGEVLTDLEPPDEPPVPVPDGCGGCELCLDACPAGAFQGPRDLDAGKCISAWTVESREEPSDTPDLHGHLFGCDRCQEVCPYNREAPLSTEADFAPREPWFAPLAEDVLGLSADEWDRLSRGSNLRRAGYEGLLRNARKGMGPRTL